MKTCTEKFSEELNHYGMQFDRFYAFWGCPQWTNGSDRVTE